MDPDNNWLGRSARNSARSVTAFSSSVLPILGSASLASTSAASEINDTLGDAAFWAGLGLTVLGIVALFSLRPRYNELLKGRDEARESVDKAGGELKRHRKALTSALGHVCRRALEEVASDGTTNHSRISVYLERGSEFVLAARWAEHENLRKLGRSRFPLSQGLIGEAWASDRGAASVQMPAGRDEWIRYQVDQYGMSEETAKGLTMHARMICAVRVNGDRKTPIVVFESLKPDLPNLGKTQALRDLASVRDISRIISDPEIVIPTAHDGNGENAQDGGT